MKRKKNKKVLLVILLIIGLILVGTGTSLAYFNYKEDIGNKILLGDDAFIALEDLPEELEFGYEIEPDPSAFLGNGGVIGSYEFMVRGHNTSEKPIYYSIYLSAFKRIRVKKKDEYYPFMLCIFLVLQIISLL